MRGSTISSPRSGPGELLEGHVAEREAILDQIEAGWQAQSRRPTAEEIDAWMAVGRP